MFCLRAELSHAAMAMSREPRQDGWWWRDIKGQHAVCSADAAPQFTQKSLGGADGVVFPQRISPFSAGKKKQQTKLTTLWQPGRHIAKKKMIYMVFFFSHTCSVAPGLFFFLFSGESVQWKREKSQTTL